MSIYGSMSAPNNREHEDDCDKWDKHEGHWELSKRPCTCGQPDAPLVYQGSHVLPSEDDERGGWIDIACILAHVRFWRENPDAPVEDEPDWPNVEPFLRFGVNESTVVLTERNVRQIADTLNEWLAARAQSTTVKGEQS